MSLKDFTREQLEKLATSYNLDFNGLDDRALRIAIKQHKNGMTAKKENMVSPKSKEELIIDFIKSIASIEDAILPYKEQMKDLKKEYVDNGWLSKDEEKMAIKAYKMLKNAEDLEMLVEFFNKIQQATGV